MTQSGQIVGSGTVLNHLALADGTRVVTPEDLLPAVQPGSVAEREATEFVRIQRRGSWVSGSSAIVSLVGLGLLAPGVVVAGQVDRSGNSTGSPILLIVSSVLAGTGLIGVLVGSGMSGASAPHRVQAFTAFDESLRQRLGICGSEDETLDCDSATGAGRGGPLLVPIRR